MSRESGEFAARNRVGLGLAFTNLPLAAEAARFYRECCAAHGWEPTPEMIIYQLPVHVADTDAQAFDNVRPGIEAGLYGGGLANANRLVASAGFFGGRDAKLTERFKNIATDAPRTLEGAIEMGTIMCGGPASVAAQVRRLSEEIGCGVLNLIFERYSPLAAKRRSIELFAKEVMPGARAL